jgi:hypothetical protein
VNDAEVITYATSVRPDQTAKTQRITLGLGLLAILIIVILATALKLSLANNDNDGDRTCYLPAEEQNVFAHCICNETTAGLVWSDEERHYYDQIQLALRNLSVVDDVPNSVDSCTPQNQCLVWMANYERRNLKEAQANLTFENMNVTAQAYIMCVMYLQMDGRNWKQNDGWVNNSSPCEWFGVTCSFLARATGIRLPSNGLNGTLPSELGRMAFLSEY